MHSKIKRRTTFFRNKFTTITVHLILIYGVQDFWESASTRHVGIPLDIGFASRVSLNVILHKLLENIIPVLVSSSGII